MRNAWAICRKELNSYFASPIAYLVIAFFAIVFGVMFYAATSYFVEQGIRLQMQGQMFPLNLNEYVIRPLMMNVSVISLFLVPMITMRLFAEEKRSGTIELLLTSPVKDWEIIMGKWLAALVLYACMLAVTLVDLGFLFVYGQPDWKPMLAGYLGLLLQGGALLAIGAFISTLTRNQIIAAGVTFAVLLLLWILDWVSSFRSDKWAQVVSYMSVVTHLESFAKGVLDTKDVVFYLTAIALGLFLTARSMESVRWRA